MVACNNLGYMYEMGKGVPEDIYRANALYRKACDGSHMAGCNNLGVNYDEEGARSDSERTNSLSKPVMVAVRAAVTDSVRTSRATATGRRADVCSSRHVLAA